MTIQEIIDRGKAAAAASIKHLPMGGEVYYGGPEYQKWLSLATRFLEKEYPNDADTARFAAIAARANGRGPSQFETLIGILEAFDTIQPKPETMPIESIIYTICFNFHRFDQSIQNRHDKRDTIHINDEYDLQDALRSILKLFVDDIRPEDYVPEYAGAKSRVDFNLPEFGILIETKMASSSLKDKTIGDQLVIDYHHYKAFPGCKHLICFVYDKDSNILNPHGLKTDLEKLSDNELKMTVIISP